MSVSDFILVSFRSPLSAIAGHALIQITATLEPQAWRLFADRRQGGREAT
jgi:hypothetical protein